MAPRRPDLLTRFAGRYRHPSAIGGLDAMGDPPQDSPRVKVSDWYRISGPLPLYAHNDDPRLAGWRQQATRAFSRVEADIVWRAHVAEHSGEDRPERPPSHRAGMTPVGQVSRGRGESILARLRPNAPLRTPARRSCKRDGP